MVLQLVNLLMEPQNRHVGHKLFLYTMAMFSVPVLVFFICREWVFVSDPRRRDMWSGFASVASVNVIIALYVVMAFREDKDEEKRQPVPAVGVWAMQRTKERTD
ncbi:vma21p [Nannochloropsis oceanica]